MPRNIAQRIVLVDPTLAVVGHDILAGALIARAGIIDHQRIPRVPISDGHGLPFNSLIWDISQCVASIVPLGPTAGIFNDPSGCGIDVI